ncbi:MAG: hypothetical protein OEQ25_10345 [Gammaproteobacteria bacterium]|nr:hypothetical protein [Gammaproteobacteria bacterium]MDH3507526.1 hypothetical protein [Gammaproteobacteria bacterium]
MSVPETEIVYDDTLDEEESESMESDPATDNVGDPSVEINVEELLQTLESELPAGLGDKASGARHRLEELMESKRARQDLEDFDDYKI